METGLDNANAANNPFGNANCGAEILPQKENFLLNLTEGFKHSNGASIASPTNDPFGAFDRPANGKRAVGGFDDDDDMGPETDVDAVDDLPSPMDNKMFQDNNKMEAAFNPFTDIDEKSSFEMDLHLQKQQTSDFELPSSPREETPTPPADEVHDAAIEENVGDSAEESEDEWNYFKGNSAATETSTSKTDQEVADINKAVEDIQEEDDDMSQLNPNAAEFVPVSSPTRNVASPACRALINDEVIAQSPRRATPSDIDINLPNPQDFESEVKSRPSEIFNNSHESENGHKLTSQEVMENLLNGRNIEEIEFHPSTPSKNTLQDEFHFGPNAAPFSTPGKFLDQSEAALSTKAVFGDESTASYLDGKNLGDEGSFADSFNAVEESIEFKPKEQDPMSMSFYQDENDDTNPFDLNKVQALPVDIDEFIGTTDNGEDNIKENIQPDDFEDQLLGVSKLPKTPEPEFCTSPTLEEVAKEPLPITPEPTMDEFVENPVESREEPDLCNFASPPQNLVFEVCDIKKEDSSPETEELSQISDGGEDVPNLCQSPDVVKDFEQFESDINDTYQISAGMNVEDVLRNFCGTEVPSVQEHEIPTEPIPSDLKLEEVKIKEEDFCQFRPIQDDIFQVRSNVCLTEPTEYVQQILTEPKGDLLSELNKEEITETFTPTETLGDVDFLAREPIDPIPLLAPHNKTISCEYSRGPTEELADGDVDFLPRQPIDPIPLLLASHNKSISCEYSQGPTEELADSLPPTVDQLAPELIGEELAKSSEPAGNVLAKSPDPAIEEELAKSPELVIEEELAKSPEPITQEEFAKSPEPIAEMPKSPEPIREEELVRSPEPIVEEELVRSPEPNREEDLAKSPEPLGEEELPKSPEPNRQEEFAKSPEPLREELGKSPEPLREEELPKSPEPSREEEFAKSPEPLREEELPKSPEPNREEELAKSPEPLREEELEISPEPLREEELAKSPEPLREEGLAKSPEPLREEELAKSPEPLREEELVKSPEPDNELIAKSPEPCNEVVVPEPFIEAGDFSPSEVRPTDLDFLPDESKEIDSPMEDITSSIKDDVSSEIIEEAKDITTEKETTLVNEQVVQAPFGDISQGVVEPEIVEANPTSTPKSITETESIATTDLNSFLERSSLTELTSPLSPPSQLVGEELNTAVIKTDIIAPQFAEEATILTPSTETPPAEAPAPLPEVAQDADIKEVAAAATAAIAVAAVATAAATAKPKDKKALAKPLAKTATTAKKTPTRTTPVAAKTTTQRPLSKTPTTKPASPTKAPIPKTSTSRVASTTRTTTSTMTRPSLTKPKVEAPKSTEKKPLTNGDVKPAARTSLVKRTTTTTTTARPAPTTTSRLTASRLSPTKPPADKPLTKTSSPRPSTLMKTSTATTTSPKPRPTTLSATAARSAAPTTKSTLTKTSSATSPRTATAKPRPATAPIAPRPRPATLAKAKTPDTEKQIKDSANKLLTSRTTTRTTGSGTGRTTTTTTTVKKTEAKVPTRTTTTTKTTITSIKSTKKPAEITRVASTTKTKLAPTKTTKPQANGLTNGITKTVVQETTAILSTETELIKDLSPVENKFLIENSQTESKVAD